MTLHEGIKQYHNKLIQLIEVLNIYTGKWYKFQTPTDLPSTWMPPLSIFTTLGSEQV